MDTNILIEEDGYQLVEYQGDYYLLLNGMQLSLPVSFVSPHSAGMAFLRALEYKDNRSAMITLFESSGDFS